MPERVAVELTCKEDSAVNSVYSLVHRLDLLDGVGNGFVAVSGNDDFSDFLK